jgi:signal transduction histidine kinase
VNSSGKHLLSLITDFLDISKIEAGVLTLQRSEFDLQELLGLDLRMHESAAQARGLEFAFLDESAAASCRVKADAKRVRQIVDNLLSNAIKFTDTGKVRLHVADDDSGVRVTVEDTGIGIANEQLQRLFEPFARIESPGAHARDGTGLGLAIAKRLAEAMGGTIGVTSDPGRGSRFWFTLPRSE